MKCKICGRVVELDFVAPWSPLCREHFYAKTAGEKEGTTFDTLQTDLCMKDVLVALEAENAALREMLKEGLDLVACAEESISSADEISDNDKELLSDMRTWWKKAEKE